MLFLVNRKVFKEFSLGIRQLESFLSFYFFATNMNWFWTTWFYAEGPERRRRSVQNNWLESLNFERRNRSTNFPSQWNDRSPLRSLKDTHKLMLSALYCKQASFSLWTLESNFKHQLRQKGLTGQEHLHCELGWFSRVHAYTSSKVNLYEPTEVRKPKQPL